MPPRALENTHFRFSFESRETIFDDIGDKEDDYTDECCDKGMYIGIPIYDTHYDVNLLASRVSTKSFFDYDIDEVMDYLSDNNIIETNTEVQSHLILCKLILMILMYIQLLLKTHWLRLVQRKWKNVIQRRKNIMRHPTYIRNREIHGINTTMLPSLRGMLSNI